MTTLLQSDAFLFDIDGTLLNVTDATHYFAFLNAMRAVFNVECDLSGIPIHGNSDVGILRAALRNSGVSDQVFERNIERAIEQMCDEVVRNAAQIQAVPCSSVHLLLERLQRQGKLLGIITGNLEPIGWAKLEAAGVRDFFEFGCFSAHLTVNGERNNGHVTVTPMLRFERRSEILAQAAAEVRQRLGDSASMCVIGDTPSDIQAARELGLPIIAVGTGKYSCEALQALSPDLCLESLDELLA